MEIPLSVEVEASIASINCSLHQYLPWKVPRASIYPYILPPTSTSITNLQLLLQEFHKGPTTYVRSAFMEVSTNFYGNVHGSQLTPMETSIKSVQEHLLPWKFRWKSVKVSVQIHRSFHDGWKWKLPLLPSIAASTKICRVSFHELPYTPTYILPPSSTNITISQLPPQK